MADIIDTTAPAQVDTPVVTEPTAKTFTQAELDAVVEKRIARIQKDIDARIKAAATEAEKLAKMDADQRLEHERAEREKTLADRESGITKRELKAEALQQLAEKGLPKELSEVLPYSDADSTNAAIVAVEKAFRKAVEIGVNERLKGNPPKIGTPGATKSERDKLIDQYNEAEKRGDVKTMFTLDAKIKALKKE